LAQILKLTAADKKMLLGLLADLVAADTTNPPGNEVRAAKVVTNFLRKEKIKFTSHAKAPGRPNLLWSLGSGSLEIFLAAHSDTVPAGDGWQTDPLRLTRQKGQLIGRGVVDNKGSLAGLLLVTRLLKKIESQLKCKITFGAVADEEHGNEFGLKYLLQKKIIRPDLAIIPDSCGHNRLIAIAEKQVLHLKIRAFGKQGHGSLPESGINAFEVLQDFLIFVKDLPKKFPRRDPLLGGLTINIGAVHAGHAVNIIPGEAMALIDLRFPPQIVKAKVRAALQKFALKTAKKWHCQSFQIETIADLPGSSTPVDHLLVKEMLAVSRAVLGNSVRAIGLPAFTFASLLRESGVPAISCGPGELAQCHCANECLPEKELCDFVIILVNLLTKLACQKN
jgi:acetylornithine deacetylase/succinyl-diaminopimelate desuccinylase family protein